MFLYYSSILTFIFACNSLSNKESLGIIIFGTTDYNIFTSIQLISQGHTVIITSHDYPMVNRTVSYIKKENKSKNGKIFGFYCNPSIKNGVKLLLEFSYMKIKKVDIVIFNPSLKYTYSEKEGLKMKDGIMINMKMGISFASQIVDYLVKQKNGFHFVLVDGYKSNYFTNYDKNICKYSHKALHIAYNNVKKKRYRCVIGINTYTPTLDNKNIKSISYKISTSKFCNFLMSLKGSGKEYTE